MSERTRKFLAYIANQGSQASTWRGLILVGTAAFGWTLPPEKMTAVISIGIMAAGAVGILFPDELTMKKSNEPKEAP